MASASASAISNWLTTDMAPHFLVNLFRISSSNRFTPRILAHFFPRHIHFYWNVINYQKIKWKMRTTCQFSCEIVNDKDDVERLLFIIYSIALMVRKWRAHTTHCLRSKPRAIKSKCIFNRWECYNNVNTHLLEQCESKTSHITCEANVFFFFLLFVGLKYHQFIPTRLKCNNNCNITI